MCSWSNTFSYDSFEGYHHFKFIGELLMPCIMDKCFAVAISNLSRGHMVFLSNSSLIEPSFQLNAAKNSPKISQKHYNSMLKEENFCYGRIVI